MGSRLVLNRAEIDRLLTSKNGPVAKDLGKRASKIQACAKRKTPVDTGRLRNSIDWQLRTDKGDLVARIGTGVEYARVIHDGYRGPQVVRSHTRNGSTVRSHIRNVDRTGTEYLVDCLPAGRI